ncbi:SRPBCC family protein [Mycolicibacterium sp. CR10]|uniref:SRPBCC family protein n=1 Tax=Mycolicibacterium sp. CR10 TaxID=2562314 RepID=UPI0010C119C0|nr:SRPBCC family protein [Mycolicibacterium sp. CR10]
MSTEERFVATRNIAATPSEIFAVLADPNRHQDTEPNDWVRDAVSTEIIAGTGQIFAVNMYLERIGGHYVVHNLVTAFEPDRTIEWLPGNVNGDGNHEAGGWSWRYDLAPAGDGTDVTLTYDWSGTPQALRERLPGLPPFGADFLDRSLSTLADTVETRERT